MNSLFSVKEKVILLTGGYGILGACMAKHLAGSLPLSTVRYG